MKPYGIYEAFFSTEIAYLLFNVTYKNNLKCNLAI
jgi:hypothetical protein